MAAWRKSGYSYPSGLEKTLCKWDIYVPLVRKSHWLTEEEFFTSKLNLNLRKKMMEFYNLCITSWF
jgi:hypothetical protein